MSPIGLPLPGAVPTLEGEHVLVRAGRPSDAAVIARLGLDPAVLRVYGAERAARRGLTQAEAAVVVDRLTPTSSSQGWVIETGGRVVGNARLFAVDPDEQRARYSIGLFAKEFVGHGIGREATRLVLTYAFAVLGLHRVALRVLGFNAIAIACFRACGFVEEGRERESVRFDDTWQDIVTMGVLDREFARFAASQPDCGRLSGLARVVREELGVTERYDIV
ncbi:MAG TPA: GNAT family protein [Thermoleophilia bacterium]|nr:GNAT family protein [Thermoleophilia bacterium]